MLEPDRRWRIGPAPRGRMPRKMEAFHGFLRGPWRAVLVLGVTQIIAWGALFYPAVLTLPLVAADNGWSVTFAMGGFSLACSSRGSFLRSSAA